VLGTSSEASALQPVDAFVRAARQANPANRQAAALEAQRTAEAQVATGRLYPAISATGTYTRNQYQIALTLPGSTQSITIQPQNQLDGALTLSVPVVDFGAFERRGAAKAAAEAAAAGGRATTFEVERRQLDVIQAEQDSFHAEVARIQADTDLAYARAALHPCGGHLSGVRPQ